MSKVFSVAAALIRPFVLLGAAVLLLAACGNAEKSDLMAFGQAIKETGYTQQTHQQFQARLATAQSEEEVKTILNEMFAIFDAVPPKLDAVPMKSEEVKKLRDDFSSSLRALLTSTRGMMELDSADPAAAEQAAVLQKNMMEAQTKLLDAQNRLMVLAGKHGLELQ